MSFPNTLIAIHGITALITKKMLLLHVQGNEKGKEERE